MKIDRLIGILSILLQKEMTTAPELAEHFEVSRRTINRDKVTVLEPEEIREKLYRITSEIAKRYKGEKT